MKLFILGFLMATLGYSLIESVITILSGVTELIISKINVKIAKYNREFNALSIDNSPKHAIGFEIPADDDEGDFDFDD